MKNTVLCIIGLAFMAGCGTSKNPTTERQMKNRIEHLEYQKHVRDREIQKLRGKLDECGG